MILNGDNVLVVVRSERHQRVLLRRPEVGVERSFRAFGDESDERANVAVVGRHEMLVVQESILLPDDDGRESVLHQDQVHEEAGCATVSVDKRMNVNLVTKFIKL